MAKLRKLNEFEAAQFAMLAMAGVPNTEIVLYFLPTAAEDEDVQEAVVQWPRQREVVQEMQKFSKGPWQDLTDTQRWEAALAKTYNEMAYFLWSHNYAELTGSERQKADTCRMAIEAKMAGTSGQSSPMERMYQELAKKYAETGSARVKES